MTRSHLELLSPARDSEIGIEAIRHGADAVYIGGPGFGARDKASNSLADIARLAAFAHRFDARIFLTLNTILRDDELEPARQLAWQAYEAGVDALIVQDLGLLELDLPPIQLHASTQTDLRTPEKARFLQDVGFSQMVLARELTLPEIHAISDQVQDAVLEFFIHGALCVAYSGQCFISHAHTGRSANRGNCSQECRLPYTVLDGAGRVVAHDKHVLSLKDNDQTANLEALVDAGIRSFKIEGRYKDMATVKNVTAHYRQQLDAVLERRPALARSSRGRSTFTFTPDPDRGFNRGGTDYFVQGRKADIGAFDTPKHAGRPVGEVLELGDEAIALETLDASIQLENGDALTWYDLQGELHGAQINRAEALGGTRWRVWLQTERAATPPARGQRWQALGLRRGTAVSRNREQAWERLLARPSADRRRALDVTLATWRREGAAVGLELSLEDEGGARVVVRHEQALTEARDATQAQQTVRDTLSKLGTTDYALRRLRLAMDKPWFVPVSVLNALRREAVAQLDAARAAQWQRLPRATPVSPPVPYPEDTLSYLANVYNRSAAAFYARHGVKVIDAAYESHEELGEVSLMITRHCVRYSLSLCPKQAKGVTGVQGTVKAEPLILQQGEDRLTLRFDCKPCEMHVVGAMRRPVLKQLRAEPLTFYRTRPTASA